MISVRTEDSNESNKGCKTSSALFTFLKCTNLQGNIYSWKQGTNSFGSCRAQSAENFPGLASGVQGDTEQVA